MGVGEAISEDNEKVAEDRRRSKQGSLEHPAAPDCLVSTLWFLQFLQGWRIVQRQQGGRHGSHSDGADVRLLLNAGKRL